jgi:hypothetical protein
VNLDQGAIANGLYEEIMEVIDQYDEATYLPTVLGVLDLVKFQLIQNHLEDLEDEDE